MVLLQEPLLKTLVDAKADIDRESDRHGFTPLMYAVMVDNGATDPLQVCWLQSIHVLFILNPTTARASQSACQVWCRREHSGQGDLYIWFTAEPAAVVRGAGAQRR